MRAKKVIEDSSEEQIIKKSELEITQINLLGYERDGERYALAYIYEGGLHIALEVGSDYQVSVRYTSSGLDHSFISLLVLRNHYLFQTPEERTDWIKGKE